MSGKEPKSWLGGFSGSIKQAQQTLTPLAEKAASYGADLGKQAMQKGAVLAQEAATTASTVAKKQAAVLSEAAKKQAVVLGEAAKKQAAEMGEVAKKQAVELGAAAKVQAKKTAETAWDSVNPVQRAGHAWKSARRTAVVLVLGGIFVYAAGSAAPKAMVDLYMR